MGNDTRNLIDSLARTPLSIILIFALVLTAIRIVAYNLIKSTPRESRGAFWFAMNGTGELCDALVYAAIFIFMVIRPYFFQTFQIPSGSMVPTCMVGDFIGLEKLIYRYTEPQRGDIVVFRPPVQACFPKQLAPDGSVNVDFVKRLVGLPGDKVEIKMGQVYINDKPLYEPYKQYTYATNPEQTEFRILEGLERNAVTKANWKLVKYKGQLIPLNYTDFDANMPGRGYDVAEKYVIPEEKQWPVVRSLPAEKIPPGYFLFMGDNRNYSFDGRGWGLVPRSNIVGRAEFVWLPFPRIGKLKFVPNGEKPALGGEVADFLK